MQLGLEFLGPLLPCGNGCGQIHEVFIVGSIGHYIHLNGKIAVLAVDFLVGCHMGEVLKILESFVCGEDFCDVGCRQLAFGILAFDFLLRVNEKHFPRSPDELVRPADYNAGFH